LPLDITTLAFVVHIAAGALGLASGTVAAFAPKGGRLHREAGTVFFAAMVLTAIFAAYLAVVRPGQIVNLFIAAFTLYLVATAWMAARRNAVAGLPEKIALVVALLLCAPFAVLSFELATDLPPFFASAVPLEGPVLVAIYAFTFVLAIAAATDAKVVLAGGISGPPRIVRHLWRMCLGLTLAAGSAFTNGLPRLLPGPMHVRPIYFLPQFVPVALLVFWTIRVRFTRWLKPGGVAGGPPPAAPA
jgi:uncharacterized membrane protein